MGLAISSSTGDLEISLNVLSLSSVNEKVENIIRRYKMASDLLIK